MQSEAVAQSFISHGWTLMDTYGHGWTRIFTDGYGCRREASVFIGEIGGSYSGSCQKNKAIAGE